jgi:4-hydroxy-L-threonine phosphate dehydrogenase PdxA
MDGGTRDAKPLIALAMGDPAGISPELTAKAVGLDEVHSRARLIVVATAAYSTRERELLESKPM